MLTPVTESFAKAIADADYRTFSKRVIWNAKLHILDTIGAALAAVSYPIGRVTLAYCKRVGGFPEATVWGSSLRTSLPMAAFANGTLAHGIDFDDWEAILLSGHPSCMIVAAALTVGESIGAGGRDILKAYVLGVEVYNRIASGAPDIRRRGFHGTPIFGTMGSAAAAASLLELNVEDIKIAFGIAASGASGIQRQHGTMTKSYHAGNAARNGVEAASLAKSGFTSDSAIFESPLGFCDTLFGEGKCDYRRMLTGWGDPYYIESPGLSFKAYPFSAAEFLAADAVLYLVHRHNIAYEDVARVEISISPLRYKNHYVDEIKSGIQAKFAINYVAAIGILEGRFAKENFLSSKLTDPQVREALGKVKVVVDSSIPESHKEEFCPVTIELKDGKRLSHSTNIPKGHPNNPVTDEEVIDKFRNNVAELLSRERCEKLIASVMGLEELGNVQKITDLLVPE